MSIADNILDVRRRIDSAMARAGRSGEAVTVVAASKTAGAEAIREVIDAGIADIGENRLQDALPKVRAIGPGPKWHFIGYLQRNKVRHVVEFADLIQSVDRVSLLEEIERRAAKNGKTQRILIEVNVAGEEAKAGVDPPQLGDMLWAAAQLAHVKVEGLMTIAPLTSDAESVRPVFRELRRVFDKIGKEKASNVEMLHLSMGMTDDFEVALEEGSNMVRVGRAIFAG